MRNEITINAIRQQILFLKGKLFNAFINELYILLHGDGFIPIKQCRDKGCDGILKNHNAIIAAYAPEINEDIRSFKRKIKDDYKKYKDYWSIKYNNWHFVFNGELTAERINAIDDLKHDTAKTDIVKILSHIKSLPWCDKFKISEYLNIPEMYLIRDVLEEILDDLVKNNYKGQIVTTECPIYINKKINLNYKNQLDKESFLSEYNEYLEAASTIKGLLRKYDDNGQLGDLKARVINDFNEANGNFKQRFNCLTKMYSSKYKSDNTYKKYTRFILIYLFENCYIGVKTEYEKAIQLCLFPK